MSRRSSEKNDTLLQGELLKMIPVFFKKQKRKFVKEVCFQFVAIKCSKKWGNGGFRVS